MKLSIAPNSTKFKFAVAYPLIVGLSIAALWFAVWLQTGWMLESRMRKTIILEVEQLGSIYAQSGEGTLIRQVKEREDVNAWDVPDYGLFAGDGRKIAGALPNVKYHPGWQIVEGPFNKPPPFNNGSIHAYATPLTDGSLLVVGKDATYISEFRTVTATAFSWAAILVAAIIIPSVILLNRSFQAKVASITKSAQAIIEGDLSHRLAVSEGDHELDGLARLLNRMLDQISALVVNVQQVSNDIAHDLRTPITRLRQRLDDAQRTDLTVGGYRLEMQSAIGELDTILATFGALLRIAQIESRSRRSDFRRLNVSSLIDGVIEVFAPVVEESGKVLVAQIDPGVSMLGDRELLTQLVFNLVENAIHHTPRGTKIEVKLQRHGSSVALRISDNGGGVPEGARHKIFERFYRVEQSRSSPGSGLGLSIAKAVADLHGLKIETYDNSPGLGLMLRFPTSTTTSETPCVEGRYTQSNSVSDGY